MCTDRAEVREAGEADNLEIRGIDMAMIKLAVKPALYTGAPG